MNEPTAQPTKMTRKESAVLGGKARIKKMGKEEHLQMSSKGGQTTLQRRGVEYFKELRRLREEKKQAITELTK